MNRLAFAVSLIALGMAVAVPFYVEHEHAQALKRQADREAKAAAQRRTAPTSGCTAGQHQHYRVSVNNGSMIVSSPVWTDEGVVRCGEQGYTVNGRPISEAELKGYVQETLVRLFSHDAGSSGSSSGIPVVDPAQLLTTKRNATGE